MLRFHCKLVRNHAIVILPMAAHANAARHRVGAASLLPIKGDATDFVRALTDGLARLAARLAHR